MERLYRELEQYAKKDIYPFHMPGHKRNPRSTDGTFPFEQDITEIIDFDNLHHARGILKEAQDRAAGIYGAKESFYSINGSTAALLSAVSACVKRGGQLLMARNCHKAVYHGVYLRDIRPTYIYPHTDLELGINEGISVSRVERCLEENPDIEAVLITSPTYDGVVSDVKGIAEAAHSRGIPLIVDEAHGAHFRFSDYFPVSAAELGADLVVHSVHKTLPSLTQTALIHRFSDRVDSGLLRRFLGIYQSSSPSYVLMASIDACMDKLSRDGDAMFSEYVRNLKQARERLKKCRYICLETPETGSESNNYAYDRSKIILSTRNSSLNGRQLHELLNQKYHLEMEMEAENYVIALTSVGDTKEGFDRLCNAVEEIDREEGEKVSGNIFSDNRSEEHKEDGDSGHENGHSCMEMRQRMRISDAMESPVQNCFLEESAGKISAEFVYLYPPGIPLIVPGEQITGLFVRNVRRYMEQGMELQGLMDLTNQTIQVVKE